jgi:hypothetical protein
MQHCRPQNGHRLSGRTKQLSNHSSNRRKDMFNMIDPTNRHHKVEARNNLDLTRTAPDAWLLSDHQNLPNSNMN